MRKIIISFCILFAALSLQAQSVNGIRIDGGNTPILVYLGGNQICLPTTTCFIANLNPGHYTVDILIWQKTDLGFKAIIDNKYSGLLYENEIFCPLETGMEMKAFVKQVREDGKVDLILQKPGFEKIDDFSKTLLDYIKAHGGRINLNDKSPAEDIYDTFGVSKKTFKKGVGDLYKKRLITLHEDGIALADS